MLGYAEVDYKALLGKPVDFVLCRTAINHHLKARHGSYII
jgi:hypothetical protein